MTYYGRIRSPETKEEVKTAAKILFGLAVVFALVAVAGILIRTLQGDKDGLILTIVGGFVSLLCFAVAAYNNYYTKRMTHAPFVAMALRNPTITVIVIMLGCVVFTAGMMFLIISL